MKLDREQKIGIAIVLTAIVVAVGAIAFVLSSFAGNRPLRIFNQAGEPLHNVSVRISRDDLNWTLERSFVTIAPGETIAIDTHRTDWEYTITYTLRNQPYTRAEEYVDLWTTDAWLVTIHADGSADAGYDLPDSQQAKRP